MGKERTCKVIEGLRIRLRPAGLDNIFSDSREILKWLRDYDVKESLRYFSFFQAKPTLGRQMRYFAGMIESKDNQVFIIETKSGEFIGTCGLHDIDRVNDNLRLGIIIFNKNYLRQGYGRETLNLLLDFAFGELHMNKVYLTVRADNDLAINIYRKLGFKEEGVMRKEYKIRAGEYLDLLRMSILKEERNGTKKE